VQEGDFIAAIAAEPDEEANWIGYAATRREVARVQTVFDADLRGPDGRIDALGAWINGRGED